MSGPRIGELFAGYGGLGMGVKAALGGEVAWVSDIDKGANKILAHRFPDVPNIGDITTVDWSQVEPVDILTGGSPCQDLSHAGRRAGTVAMLPTPQARDFKGYGPADANRNDPNLSAISLLLPTPTVMDYKASGGNPNTTGTHGTTLTDATVRGVGGMLLPTPRALDATGVRGVTPNRTAEANYRAGETLADVSHDARWGDYAASIARWEHVLGRPAPAPTQTSAKGNPQLAPAFVEWLMGLPDGWVTGVPGITRNEALKALSNGVVPQQAEAALRWLLARIEAAA